MRATCDPGMIQPISLLSLSQPSIRSLDVAREVRLLTNRALGRIEPYRRRAEIQPVVEPFTGLEVLEIGGPSAIFAKRALVPIYDVIRHHDAANYASSTLWEADVGLPRPRREFVAEATALGCPDEAYGGLLASHVIEHTANPLGALAEWRRVVCVGGPLLIVVPHRDFTFDHRREVTPLEHLREDERVGMSEGDLSHVAEVLARHDPRHDFFEGDAEAFAQRCWDNLRHRALHHHVFTTASAVQLVHAARLDVVRVVASRPHHIVILARRPASARAEALPAQTLRDVLRRSPFGSDRSAV